MEHTIIFQKICDDYRLLADLAEFFPKKDRYGIGVRLENTILHLLEAVITAETTVPALKERALIEAVTQAEIAAVLARLAIQFFHGAVVVGARNDLVVHAGNNVCDRGAAIGAFGRGGTRLRQRVSCEQRGAKDERR